MPAWAASQRAVDWIRGLTTSPEVGAIYEGKVARVVDFGAFVNFFGPKDGLVHISELAPQRVQTARPRTDQKCSRKPRRAASMDRSVERSRG